MKRPALFAVASAVAVWGALSYGQPPASDGVSAFLSGGIGKVLLALLPAVVTFIGSMPNTPTWLRKVLSFFTDMTPEPAPSPVPVPVPSPVSPREQLLALLLQLIGDRLKVKDQSGADKAMELYSRVSEDGA